MENEFAEGKRYLLEHETPLPRIMVERLQEENWQDHVLLARMLYRKPYSQWAAAQRLLEPIKGQDAQLAEELESKAWAMLELAQICLRHTKDRRNGFACLDEATHLTELLPADGMTLVKGEIWGERWNLLLEQKRKNQVLKEVNQILLAKETNNKANYSYFHHAYYAKAKIAQLRRQWEEAVEFLYKALRYFPLDTEGQANAIVAWARRKSDWQKAYQTLLELTQRTVCWQ